MSLFTWCSRRIGGLSIVALVALSYWVIRQELNAQQDGQEHNYVNSDATATKSPAPGWGGGMWTYVFVYYYILVHLAVFMLGSLGFL